MSSFNETISLKSFQGGTGTNDTTVGGLVNAAARPLFKGIWIRNTDAANTLYIGDERVSATLGHALLPGDVIALEIEDPTEVFIVGSADPTAYSWFGH